MSYEPPPILRPIPRRPFDLSLSTPPPDSNPPTPSRRASPPNGLSTNPSSSNLFASTSGADTPNFSRTRSIMNLTSSTLFGIYSPTYTERSPDEPPTPIGTGALTPLSGSSTAPARPVARVPTQDTPLPLRALGLALRSSLLFLLGTAYGLLVAHLHNEHRLAPFAAQGFVKPSYDARYLVFWGVAGVAMGRALPWVDGMWEEYFGEETSENAVVGKGKGGHGADSTEEGVAAQWTPVVRSIGAFVGIAFAIRKLPWTSTLQASLTLALVNPFLWYMLDRSKPGLLLSTTVGLLGTTGFLMLNWHSARTPPDAVPRFNSTSEGAGGFVDAYRNGKVESAVWIMSVLFCSVLCFGHIGRRLALLRRRAKA